MTVGLAIPVVLGTALSLQGLANPFGGVTMKVNTALLCALLAFAILADLSGSTKPWMKRISTALFAVAAGVSVVTLFQYVSDPDLGIDQLVVPDTLGTVGSLAPGRMAPTTAIALFAITVGGLWPAAKNKLSVWTPRQILAVAAGAIAFAQLTDWLFIPGLPAAPYRQMAVATAVCILLLCFAVIAGRPNEGIARVFSGGDLLGSKLARRLLPVVFIVPFLIGWLRLQGERQGLYDTGYGVALFVAATSVFLGFFVVAGVEKINRADRERKLYVAQLHGVQADLKQANQFLDAVFETLPTMVFVKEAQRLTFTRLNKKAEEIIGKPRNELLGLSDRDFFPPEEAAFFEAKDRETLARGEVIDISEEPIHTPQGARWLHTKKVPIKGDDGTPLFLLGISEDITSQKHNAEELRKAKELAEANSKELEAFSYSVSHDLRAPLRSIDGFSQALLEDCFDKLGDDGKDSLTRIRAAAQRMGELIDDLLELSKVTRAELRTQTVDVSALAGAVAASLKQQQPNREVELEITPELHAIADPRLLRAVLENLLGNAWKFSAKKPGARVRVFKADDQDGRDVFCVQDNGAGFDQKYNAKLFGAFQRLHAMTEFEGTGIGLATVQRIIHRHGGRVWAEGKVGEGAAFYFSLPRAVAPRAS